MNASARVPQALVLALLVGGPAVLLADRPEGGRVTDLPGTSRPDTELVADAPDLAVPVVQVRHVPTPPRLMPPVVSRSEPRSTRPARHAAPVRGYEPVQYPRPTGRHRAQAPRTRTGTGELNWAALARCEAGGNPRAVDPSGRYGGLYQFDVHTWRSVGGHGRPQDAPAAEQTARARTLYHLRGASPWPLCGRRATR